MTGGPKRPIPRGGSWPALWVVAMLLTALLFGIVVYAAT